MAICGLQASAQRVVSLAGCDWTISNSGLNISLPAKLPSYAQLDLYDNQVIGDPLYGRNNFNLRFIVWQNWTYTSAPISGLSTNSSSTWLLFNGLDTFTSISFCGQHVASTNNQFRQYWFDVSSLVSGCEQDDQVVEINFGSAANIADEIANQPGQETWADGIMQLYQFPNRWFVRKEQSDFGWDWGPAFVPAGPWQPAWIVQLEEEEVQVRNSLVDIYRQGQLNNLPPDQTQPWVVNASLDYFGSVPSSASLRYTLTSLDNKTVIASGDLANVSVTDASVTGSIALTNEDIDLWWPVGMGAQNLYYINIDLVSFRNNTLAAISKRVGFRTIVLNGNPVSAEQQAMGIAPGNNWHFEINGQQFFAKGSNFIPPDAFWPRVTPQRISDLFDTAIAGNQNMLRVWSSGAYSPDFMYDLADEKGLLLWSEFEFGCALYPVYPEFLENVRAEAEYQVRRVNHHPSLTFWAGGNELENLELPNANKSSPEEYPRLVAEYETLFLHTILPAVYENSKSISYQPSSTSNGWLSLNHSAPANEIMIQRYNNKTAGAVYGETDYYNYDSSYLGNTSSYPIGRFSNEFGYHSMPSVQSWRQQISESDLQFNSTTILLRNQHNPPGNLDISNLTDSEVGQGQMTLAIENWYPVPNKTDPIGNFSAWCHATQIFQAEFYRSQIEFYRRGSGLPNRCLGSLYWQLEDLWAAPTWAGVEYDGRWKVLHYAAKDIYEHVIIAPYFDRTTGNLSIWATSDLWENVSGTATFQWYVWNGEKLNVDVSASLDVTIGAINSTKVLQTNTTEILQGLDQNNAILRMQVQVQGHLPHSDATQTFRHENWFTPGALKDASLVDPGLELSYDDSAKQFSVTATNGIAAWVWLDYPSGAVVHFDSNGFWVAANETRKVGYTIQKDDTYGTWTDGVTVESMWNQTLFT
ncbi:putative glycoside hydrolase, family 2, immunoglobulin-like beta-sandwich, beta-mannosidase [Septoria linicola]|nr:putative glycoside hydrolase, family 2, immunoglobulin-like beta-sandwich, beta-mannosidase [Septoria linicola]